MGEAGPQEESRRRRRRVLLGSLGAVCLIVGAALAITFAGKGQSKDKPEPAATVEGGLSPMGDLPALVKDSGEKTKGEECRKGKVHTPCAELIP